MRWVTRQSASVLVPYQEGRLNGGPDQDPVRVRARRIEAPHLEVLQPAYAGLDSRGAAALEHVYAQVVVIAVPAHEPHDVPRLGHQLHAHRLVERLAAVEVRDVEVHVAEQSTSRKLLLRLV